MVNWNWIQSGVWYIHCTTVHTCTCTHVHVHDYLYNYTDKQQLAVRTGGKQLVVNQDRNIPKKKCMGSISSPSEIMCLNIII